MTPQEQITYLRQNVHQHWNDGEMLTTILAVCDLAERALAMEGKTYYCERCLLTDDEAEAVRRFCVAYSAADFEDIIVAKRVLRRLLPDERVEHRLDVRVAAAKARAEWALFVAGDEATVEADVDCAFDTLDEAIERSAHAGIGGTE